MNRPIISQVVAVFAICLVTGTSWALKPVTPITACDQVVGGVGQLMVDLACPGRGVHLRPGATLLLSGHTLSSVGIGNGVVATGPGRVRVIGPGRITGFFFGIDVDAGLVVEDVTVDGNTQAGIFSHKAVRARNVVADGNGTDGITAQRVRAQDVSVSGNGRFGILGRASLKNVVANGNGDAGISGDVRGKDVEASNNGGPGIRAGRYKLKRFIANGNVGPAVHAWDSGTRNARGRLVDSALSGNCGGTGADILADAPPRLIATTCSASQVSDDSLPLQQSWNICANDGLGLFCGAP